MATPASRIAALERSRRQLSALASDSTVVPATRRLAKAGAVAAGEKLARALLAQVEAFDSTPATAATAAAAAAPAPAPAAPTQKSTPTPSKRGTTSADAEARQKSKRRRIRRKQVAAFKAKRALVQGAPQTTLHLFMRSSARTTDGRIVDVTHQAPTTVTSTRSDAGVPCTFCADRFMNLQGLVRSQLQVARCWQPGISRHVANRIAPCSTAVWCCTRRVWVYVYMCMSRVCARVCVTLCVGHPHACVLCNDTPPLPLSRAVCTAGRAPTDEALSRAGGGGIQG